MCKAAGLKRKRAANLGQVMTQQQQQGKPFWGRAVKCVPKQISQGGVQTRASADTVRIVPSRDLGTQQLGRYSLWCEWSTGRKLLTYPS